MRGFLAAAALAALGAVSVGLAHAQQSQPDTAARSICRPQFIVDGDALSAGTGFVVEQPGPGAAPLLVTALHLFGPSGGLEADVPWADMARRVRLDRCRSLADGKDWRGGAALTIPDTVPLGDDLPYRDIAAFRPDPGSVASVPRLKLAEQPPRLGATVWLVAEVIGAPPTRRLHRAIVTYAGSDALQYRFDDVDLQIRATSGAPVVDAAGRVVGVHLGGGMDGGDKLGIANSLSTVTAALRRAR